MKHAFANLRPRVDAAMHAAVEPGFQERQQHYSKEAIQSLGVRTSTLRVIAKEFLAEVKALPLETFLDTAEAFLAIGTVEHRCIALVWAFQRRKELKPEHFPRLHGWLSNHVHDWAACDQLCGEVFGDFVQRYPQFAQETVEWARSPNRWMRRAAAVILIRDLRDQAHFLPILFQVAEILLPDRDDLVQKGYGWALKEATETREAEAVPFILKHKRHMSRTALRYSIEKLSPELRAEAMNT